MKEERDAGADTRTAVSRAVVAACSYAAPAYYVGRALELVRTEHIDRDETLEKLAAYLRAHPIQRDLLGDASHVDAVPGIRESLLEVLQRSAN